MELDEIFRAFDPRTRRAFSIWLDQQGRARRATAARRSTTALGSLDAVRRETDEVLRGPAPPVGRDARLVRDTGAVFDALTERQGQLRELIANSNRVFETTAARDARAGRDLPRPARPSCARAATTTRRLTRVRRATPTR